MEDLTQYFFTLTQGCTGRFDLSTGGVWVDLNSMGGTPTPAITALAPNLITFSGGFDCPTSAIMIPGEFAPIVFPDKTATGTVSFSIYLIDDSNCSVTADFSQLGGFTWNNNSGAYYLDSDLHLTIQVAGWSIVTYPFNANEIWYAGAEFIFSHDDAGQGSAWFAFENISGWTDAVSDARNAQTREAPPVRK